MRLFGPVQHFTAVHARSLGSIVVCAQSQRCTPPVSSRVVLGAASALPDCVLSLAAHVLPSGDVLAPPGGECRNYSRCTPSRPMYSRLLAVSTGTSRDVLLADLPHRLVVSFVFSRPPSCCRCVSKLNGLMNDTRGYQAEDTFNE